jgi:hypothetical protein
MEMNTSFALLPADRNNKFLKKGVDKGGEVVVV